MLSSDELGRMSSPQRFALPRLTGGALSRRAGRARVRRRARRRTAPHVAALQLPHARVDHLRGARVPAARRDRGARRRHLARTVRRRAVGAHAGLPVRRPAVHRRDLRSAAPVGALPLRRDRDPRELHRRSGRAASARRRPGARRRPSCSASVAGSVLRGRERGARAGDPHARGLRQCRGAPRRRRRHGARDRRRAAARRPVHRRTGGRRVRPAGDARAARRDPCTPRSDGCSTSSSPSSAARSSAATWPRPPAKRRRSRRPTRCAPRCCPR